MLLEILCGINFLLLVYLILRTKSKDWLDEVSRVIGDEFKKTEQALKNELSSQQNQFMLNRNEMAQSIKDFRGEITISVNNYRDSIKGQMIDIANLQKNQLDIFSKQLQTLTRNNEEKLEKVRETVETRLEKIRDDNNQKLELMRSTVDEKLHATLERRLGESFKLVSDRLELVHKGLGEMQNLASGVGDLKKVLTNVKTRGIWGEVCLGNLLDQILAPEQYDKNVATIPGSNERVEFAVKLPGRDGDKALWLPIDSKFPEEDYERILNAQDPATAEEAAKALELRIKGEAKDIKNKYVATPYTTDFGIMFLPTEGLFAEVIRRPGLVDLLQKEYRIVVTGPTTLLALLNSLQMGFRTLAIEKRTSEVWQLLGAVKTEFGRFGDVLEKTKKKLQEAGNTIDDAARKSRGIERKLRDVQYLPQEESSSVLEISDISPAEKTDVLSQSLLPD